MPGSRVGEVKRLLPVFGEVADRLARKRPDLSLAIPAAPHLREQVIEAVSGWERKPLLVSPEEKAACFKACDVALAASGTVSLELAMAGAPAVIGYRLSPLTAAIVRRMVKVKYATLVNLILDRPVVPEFLLEDCTAENLEAAVETLLDDRSAAAAMRAGYTEALVQLGYGAMHPGEVAAQAILDEIN